MQHQYEKREFQHDEATYEVRIVTDGQTIWVRAFRDGRPANLELSMSTQENALLLR